MRHPLDVVLSCYAQPFEGRGTPWAWDLQGAPFGSGQRHTSSPTESMRTYLNWFQSSSRVMAFGPTVGQLKGAHAGIDSLCAQAAGLCTIKTVLHSPDFSKTLNKCV